MRDVVEKAQPQQIAGAIKKLADDQNGYTQMSLAAGKRAQQFSWKSTAQKYVDCYHTILKRI